MAKNSGGTRKRRSQIIVRTGTGFTEPIKGPTEPSSSATEIQYVFTDKITGNQSDGYKNLDAVKTAIKEAEKNDKKAGMYEKDSYYIERIENIKCQGRSEHWHFGK